MSAFDHITCRRSWLVAIILLGADRASGGEPTFQVLAEKPVPGVLRAVSADWQLTFATDGNATRTVPAAQLTSYGEWLPPGRGTHVLLNGGGWIVGDLLSLSADKLTVDSDPFGEVAVPLELVNGIVFRVGRNRRTLTDFIAKCREEPRKSDAAYLPNGDLLVGKVAGLVDGKLEIRSPQPTKLELAKVAAISFNPALATTSPVDKLHAWIGWKDGSRIRATEITTAEKTCRISVAGGLKLSAPLAALSGLQPLGGAAIYLSDLKPDAYRFIPYLTWKWPYHLDHNVLGGPLVAQEQEFLKGLGLHTAASLTYLVPEGTKQFAAEIGIDDAAGPRGSVSFRVFGEGPDGQWKSRYESPVLRGGGPLVPVVVDVTGLKRVSLLAEFADRGDELDYADWLNARFLK